MSKKRYTAAVIGTGRIGFTLGFDRKREQPASHTMALLSNKRVNIVCGVDVDEEKLFQWQKFVGKKQRFSGGKPDVFTSVDSFLKEYASSTEKKLPDIVVIAVNEDSHLETAIKVIKAKPKLLILEKPVALNVEEGNRIVSSAKENDVSVLVNHERRFSKDYQIAGKYINKIGKIQSIEARLDSGLRVYSKQNEADGSYSLLHDGTHLVDVLLYLLECKCEDDEMFSGLKNENKVLLSDMKLLNCFLDEKDENVVRNICVGYKCPFCNDIQVKISGRSRFFGFEIRVVGTEGAFSVGNGIFSFEKRCESKLYTGFYSLKKDKSVRRPKKTCYFSNMLQNGIDFLDGKASLKSTLKTGMNALSLLEEIKNHL